MKPAEHRADQRRSWSAAEACGAFDPKRTLDCVQGWTSNGMSLRSTLCHRLGRE
jgi:hypothetical protein